MNESQEQRVIVDWFRATWPEHAQAVRVSMAGLPRYGKKGAIQWGMMKGQGVVNGESDIAICLPRGGFGSLFIEHKAQDGAHKTSEAQQDYINYHNANGNCACVTKGVDAAKAAIRAYMEQWPVCGFLIGEISLSRMESGNYWLAYPDGEAMEADGVKFDEYVAKFYADNF